MLTTHGTFHQSSKAKLAAPCPDAPSFRGSRVCFWWGFFCHHNSTFQRYSCHCTFQKEITEDKFFEITYTHKEWIASGGCNEDANGLTQLQAAGTCPAKICFKIEGTSATLSVWCQVYNTALVLFFSTQPQNQPDHFPEITRPAPPPSHRGGFSHNFAEPLELCPLLQLHTCCWAHQGFSWFYAFISKDFAVQPTQGFCVSPNSVMKVKLKCWSANVLRCL